MRLKLIVGVILCVLALLGMIVSAYAYKKTSEKKEDIDNIVDELFSIGTGDTTMLKERKDTVDDEYETWRQAANLSAVISIILLILGQILVIIDVGKIKIPEEEAAEERSEKKGSKKEDED